MFQWLGLSAFTALAPGSITGQGIKIQQVVWCSCKKKRERERERKKKKKYIGGGGGDEERSVQLTPDDCLMFSQMW